MAKAHSVPWTRDHQLIALNLYCKLPFGKLHSRNPIIIEIAEKMGRTANSLALKLVNFASLDPVLQARGIKGMSGATQADRVIWEEFRKNIAVLGPQSEQLLHDVAVKNDQEELDLLDPDQLRFSDFAERITEGTATVKARRGQHFFRQSFLSAYGVACCISGINIPELLVASHITPWRMSREHRLDPRNGLCLSSLHDRAFDAGLITLDENLRLVLSRQLRDLLPRNSIEQNFLQFEQTAIRLPEKVVAQPSQIHLEYHRHNIFKE